MDLTDVLLRRLGEIPCLNDGAVDVFAPILPLFLFVNGSEVLTNEFRVNRQKFN